MLKHIRNVPWEMGDIIPDYVLGPSTCALFLRYVSVTVSVLNVVSILNVVLLLTLFDINKH